MTASLQRSTEPGLTAIVDQISRRIGATPFDRNEPAIVNRINLELDAYLASGVLKLSFAQQREIVRAVYRQIGPPADQPRQPAPRDPRLPGERIVKLTADLFPDVVARLDIREITVLSDAAKRDAIRRQVHDLCQERRLDLNGAELGELVGCVLDDMLGLGPLEPLIADDTVTEIMVNGAGRVYVERQGSLQLTGLSFRDDAHVLNVATRIVADVGRRIDETSPLVDARLRDGSRVHVVIPPLSVDGPAITIRKFPGQAMQLLDLVRNQGLSRQMADYLRLAVLMRLNIVISGGTGSGKTTLLNATSRSIPPGERVITIEDAAELQLQQPHVVRLEARGPSIEGKGEVTMRTLFRNALRMRPDRIMLGEVRGDEVLDLLQAMNTGHDGTMSTLHANTPRDALTRLENMVAMSGIDLPLDVARTQLRNGLHVVVQVARGRDGGRRVTSISEVAGLDGGVVQLQELFRFAHGPETTRQTVAGNFEASGLASVHLERAAEYGLERDLDTVTRGAS